jgi:hypothetical protein
MKVLILICALSVPRPDCQTETAIDVIHGPIVNSIFECGMAGQTMVAETSLLHGQEYVKVKCERMVKP